MRNTASTVRSVLLHLPDGRRVRVRLVPLQVGAKPVPVVRQAGGDRQQGQQAVRDRSPDCPATATP